MSVTNENAIFLCYRRVDSNPATLGLYERLCEEFSSTAVFIDRNDYHAGEAWRELTRPILESARAMVVEVNGVNAIIIFRILASKKNAKISTNSIRGRVKSFDDSRQARHKTLHAPASYSVFHKSIEDVSVGWSCYHIKKLD